MKDHRFRIVLERIDDTPALNDEGTSLTFKARNHDDVFAGIERVRAVTPFTADEASALALGLKLFTGVMLKHRADPLFADVQSAMRSFIIKLKSRVASSTSAVQHEESI